jgi:hypothetical protein
MKRSLALSIALVAIAGTGLVFCGKNRDKDNRYGPNENGHQNYNGYNNGYDVGPNCTRDSDRDGIPDCQDPFFNGIGMGGGDIPVDLNGDGMPDYLGDPSWERFNGEYFYYNGYGPGPLQIPAYFDPYFRRYGLTPYSYH